MQEFLHLREESGAEEAATWTVQVKMRSFQTILMLHMWRVAVLFWLQTEETRRFKKFNCMKVIVLNNPTKIYNWDGETRMRKSVPMPPYQRPIKSVRPPLIPSENEYDKPEDGFFGSSGKLALYTVSSVVEIFTSLYSSKRSPIYNQPIKYQNTWPMQESFVIPREDETPSLQPRGHTPKRTYPIMNKDMESRAFHEGWNDNFARTTTTKNVLSSEELFIWATNSLRTKP